MGGGSVWVINTSSRPVWKQFNKSRPASVHTPFFVVFKYSVSCFKCPYFLLPSTPFVSRMKLYNVGEHREKSLIYKPNSSSITKKEDSFLVFSQDNQKWGQCFVSSSREWEAADMLWPWGVAVESEARVTIMTVVFFRFLGWDEFPCSWDVFLVSWTSVWSSQQTLYKA